MKVKINKNFENYISMCDLKVGEAGVIIDTSRNYLYMDMVVLACYAEGNDYRFVSLNDPSIMWYSGCKIKVLKLPKGTKIELEVE